MKPPLIGVSTSITVDTSPERAYVNTAYLSAIQAAGGIPVLLPPRLDGDALATLWRRLEGLVLTGGGDIDPARFGEARHAATDDVAPARDALELDLVHRALADDVPLFAICRGVQVVNVALGGSLYQDIAGEYRDAADSKRTPLRHSQTEPRDQPTHPVKVLGEGTRLAAIVGALELAVNSMHHQAIKTLGRARRARRARPRRTQPLRGAGRRGAQAGEPLDTRLSNCASSAGFAGAIGFRARPLRVTGGGRWGERRRSPQR